MNATCPRGHESETTDYCNQCGARIEGVDEPDVDEPDVDEPEVVERDPSSITHRRPPKPPPGEPCPLCRTPRNPDDRFCEVDGYDFESAGRDLSSWFAVISADHALFQRTAPADLTFPVDAPTRTVPLDAASVTIGRRSPRHGTFPDIDLGEAPEDPGASRQHARLERSHDGRYSLIDGGSANGTFLNDDAVPIPVDMSVPLADGDRIHIGAWTTIVITYRPPSQPSES